MAVATDYKITQANIQAVHVGAQPTILRGSAAQNKQVFDNYGDMISEHFNNLCEFIENNISETIDRSVLTLYASLGWVAD